MQCLQCQHENTPEAKFCNQCGMSLIVSTSAPDFVQSIKRETESEGRLYAMLPSIEATLQREGRVTYRKLKYVFGVDDELLSEIRDELLFKGVATEVDRRGLVWIGKALAPDPSTAAIAPNQPDTVETTNVSPAAFPTPPPLLPSTTTTEANGSTASPEVLLIDISPDEPAVVPEPARSVPEAERRQLTVMFCDLVGSTNLSGKLDPEDLREVVRAYQETAAEVIQRYEGHIAQYLGDGLLIYFGFPVAHEDDTQRAVYTGLGIPEAMATLNTRLQADYGVQLGVRIGIHTGPVVVGEMGGGGRHENLALGETPNIAARLEGLAQANTAVISPVTAQLVQRAFVLEELGPHELKGVADPMMLYTVVSVREEVDNDHELMTTVGFETLVGRDEEIGLLLRRWEQSKESSGQVVLISGEAGIGKSRLIGGIRRYVTQEGFPCITMRCSQYHQNSVLYPVIEHLQRWLGFEPEDSMKERLLRLEQSLESYELPMDKHVPLLAGLFSIPIPDDRYAPLSLTPAQHRQHTLDALNAWMLEESERQPLLILWEDLHWADPTTFELLESLVDQSPTAPMLNVLTFRPEFTPTWPTRSHMTPLTLNRLERPQVEALITQLTSGKTLPSEVVRHIVTRTDGVPLYVEELTKTVIESDVLHEADDHYSLTGSLNEVSIPATLSDSLMARLDRLPRARETAQLGAVIGREFAYEMLQPLANLEEPALQDRLSQLVDQELLYQRGRPPRAKYTFKHALVQDAAYQSLLRRTRQHYHSQVAQLLETRFPEVVNRQPELVAHHYTQAGAAEPAIGYWQKAGLHAIQHLANVEAIAHLTKGLDLLSSLPETPERLQQALNFQVALGPALMATKGFGHPAVEQAYARAGELCQQVGETSQLFPVLRGLIVYHLNRGQMQPARQLGTQLLRQAQGHPDVRYLLLAYFQMGMVLFLRGELASAHHHHTQALAIYTPQEHQSLVLRYGLELGASSHWYLASELWCLGYPDQALQHNQTACSLAQEASHPFSLVLALFWAVALHQLRREPQAAKEQAEVMVNLATEHGFTSWLSWSTALHGWSLVMQGQGETGIAEMQQGLAGALAAGSELWQSYCLVLLAEGYGESGNPEEGLKVVAKALTITEDTEYYWCQAELYRLKGELLLKQAVPDVSQAESCFYHALDVARNQEAKSWELRAATSLARLWQAQNKGQEAYDLLTPVYEWFTEGFDTGNLQEAKTLLEELSTDMSPPIV